MSDLKPCRVCRRELKVGQVLMPLTTVVDYKHGKNVSGTTGWVHLSCVATKMPKPTKAEIRKGLRKEEPDE